MDVTKLEEQGWTRQSVASEPRLSELVELYRELGMEVLLVSVDDLALPERGGCVVCMTSDADPGRHKVIFTRPGRAKPEGAEE